MADVPPPSQEVPSDTVDTGPAAASATRVLDEVRVAVAGAAEDVRHSVEVVRLVGAMLRVAWPDLSDVEHGALVDQVDRQSVHVGHLANRLLRIARLEPDAYGSRPEVIDLEAYLYSRLSDRLLEPPEIRLGCPPGTRVWADQDHVWQIMQFLIDAALSLVAPPVTIEILEGGGSTVFRLTDVPIDGDAVQLLFEPVLDLTVGRPSAPLLWFPRQLARANHGDVTYEADPTHPAIVLRLPSPPR